MINAGRKTRVENMAANKLIETRIPKKTIGLKLAKQRIMNPETIEIVVRTIGLPVI